MYAVYNQALIVDFMCSTVDTSDPLVVGGSNQPPDGAGGSLHNFFLVSVCGT